MNLRHPMGPSFSLSKTLSKAKSAGYSIPFMKVHQVLVTHFYFCHFTVYMKLMKTIAITLYTASLITYKYFHGIF